MSRHSHAASAHPDDPHYVSRSGWLRAAVLGANDGIVSTASLLVGIAASGADQRTVLLTGLAGLTSGALSMAAGEYVSVSSQSDTENADIHREQAALTADPETELDELAEIYEQRGLSPETAQLVARELTEHDALGTHVRDELGITEALAANPLQASVTSALTFAAGAALPVAGAVFAPPGMAVPVIWAVTLIALAVLGAVGARAGGSPPGRAVMRILIWSCTAMAITALIGKVFGVSMA
ncbi:MAG: VIT family protein [Paracoccus sp. (in: a-proteobacteria)]